MIEVKVFEASDAEDLQKNIATWLEEAQKDRMIVEVVSAAQSDLHYSYTVGRDDDAREEDVRVLTCTVFFERRPISGT